MLVDGDQRRWQAACGGRLIPAFSVATTGRPVGRQDMMADEKDRPFEGEQHGDETVFSRARRMAELVKQLPDKLVRAFSVDDPGERVDQLRCEINELSFGMLSVIGWLERHRHPGTADQLGRRLFSVTDSCLRCATLEIPEFSGGIRNMPKATPSEGLVQAGIFKAASMILADSVRGWAETIEAEEPSQRQKTEVRNKKSTNKGDAQTKIIGALSAHHQFDGGECLNLEPIGSNELARLAEVSKSSASLFFQKQFAAEHPTSGEGRRKYREACRSSYKLSLEIKRIRDELIPTELWNSLPVDHGDDDGETATDD
ncbi:MAG TPA: hypothetical protein DIC23_06425 [Planctomycetaceae bacterium]|nr:hypothetical protein [Planctomycetaceae bacterium]